MIIIIIIMRIIRIMITKERDGSVEDKFED